jgi:hypothetical protein
VIERRERASAGPHGTDAVERQPAEAAEAVLGPQVARAAMADVQHHDVYPPPLRL